MTKGQLNKLPAIVLGTKGQHVEISLKSKAIAFSRYGKPTKGEEVAGIMTLTAPDKSRMEFEMITWSHGGMSLHHKGKAVAVLSI